MSSLCTVLYMCMVDIVDGRHPTPLEICEALAKGKQKWLNIFHVHSYRTSSINSTKARWTLPLLEIPHTFRTGANTYSVILYEGLFINMSCRLLFGGEGLRHIPIPVKPPESFQVIQLILVMANHSCLPVYAWYTCTIMYRTGIDTVYAFTRYIYIYMHT